MTMDLRADETLFCWLFARGDDVDCDVTWGAPDGQGSQESFVCWTLTASLIGSLQGSDSYVTAKKASRWNHASEVLSKMVF